MNEEFCINCGRELAMNGYEKLIKELADERDQFRFEVNRLRAERRWIPVDEAHPPANEMVLVCIGSASRIMMCSIDMSGVWAGYQPTHWMPLPEPPKEVAE
jgi:hypothetical protein